MPIWRPSPLKNALRASSMINNLLHMVNDVVVVAVAATVVVENGVDSLSWSLAFEECF